MQQFNKPNIKIMRNRTLIIAIALILVSSGILTAQTTKGKFLIGEFSNITLTGTGNPMNMNLGWSTFKLKSDSGNEDNSDPNKEFSLNLTPRIGYFVINNLAFGLDFTIAYTHSKRNGGRYISNITNFGTGPFLRYYIPSQKLLPFAEASYSIGSSKTAWEYDDFDDERTTKVQQYGFGIGLGVPLGEKVSFDSFIGYQSYIYKEKEDNEDNLRYIAGTIGLKLGLTVIL
jgi:hypothetical protein